MSFQAPVYLNSNYTLAVGAGASWLHVSATPVTTAAGVVLSTDLWKVEGNAQYLKLLEDHKTLGAKLGVGSASDTVFSNIGVTAVTASVDFLIFFSNNSPIVNYIPLPGVEYIYTTQTFSGTFGFPINNLRWKPWVNWTGSLSLLGPSIISEIAYGNPLRAQGFVGFNWGAQSFIQVARVNSTDRLFYVEKRALAGGRMMLAPGMSAELATGYAFDRNIYIQDHYLFSSKGDTSTLGGSWFAEVNLRLTL